MYTIYQNDLIKPIVVLHRFTHCKCARPCSSWESLGNQYLIDAHRAIYCWICITMWPRVHVSAKIGQSDCYCCKATFFKSIESIDKTIGIICILHGLQCNSLNFWYDFATFDLCAFDVFSFVCFDTLHSSFCFPLFRQYHGYCNSIACWTRATETESNIEKKALSNTHWRRLKLTFCVYY